MPIGTVKFFNASKGFGYLSPDNGGADVFVHNSAIKDDRFRMLVQGQKVQFDVAQAPELAGPQADNVRSL